MQNLMPPVNTPDKLFHDGDPTQGIEGTIVTAEWLNNDQSAIRDLQQELVNVLAAAAMQPDPSKQDQLITAISSIIGGSIPAPPVTSVNTKTGAVVLAAADVGALPSGGTAVAATKLATARTIGGVDFDGTANINLPGVNAAGNQSTTGNAASATKLATARTIGGVAFDGTANINLPGVNAAGNQSTTGNAGSATKLATARTISGVAFDGTANITISAANVGALTQATADARYQKINGGSINTNGWFRDANTGLLIQWGRTSVTAQGQSVPFPTAFTVTPSVNITVNAGNYGDIGASSVSTTAFVLNTSATNTIGWIAIGK